jgi:hypothetical protein
MYVDMIIWLGDLNYRFVSEMDIARTYELIRTGDLTELAEW